MASITKWTSPTQEITVSDVDLTEADVYVTLKQRNTAITFEPSDLTVVYDSDSEASTVTLSLTQEQTGALKVGYASIQVNYIISNVRYATDIATISLAQNLLDEEIE